MYVSYILYSFILIVKHRIGLPDQMQGAAEGAECHQDDDGGQNAIHIIIIISLSCDGHDESVWERAG